MGLAVLTFEIVMMIVLTNRPATGGRIVRRESELEKQTLEPRRTHGQVLVIDGVIGGGPAGEPDNLGTDPIDRSQQFKNLLLHNSTGIDPTFNNSSVQIIGSPSVCSNSPDQPASLTGYISLDPSRSLFFWYLEARRNPNQAPLILWLNGGPGSSSMIGLFQENGPCRIKLDSRGFDPNPESWNENANMIYIDQPIGTGYSYGTKTAKNTSEAMIDLYESIQLFLAHPLFSKFVGRPFGVWTESYGGHYAPVLVDHILEMNSQLAGTNQPGKVTIPINSLGIGNGLTNPLVQYNSYITYAKSNPYNQSLVPKEVIDAANIDFVTPTTGCYDLIKTCQASLKAENCRQAQSFCNRKILSTLAGNRDVYDVRQVESNPYPPALIPILNDVKWKSMIGVPPTVNWTESNEDVYMDFYSTGDWMFDSSKQLERVIDAGVQTLIYAGDADFIVNYQGVEALVNSLNTTASKSFSTQNFSNWVIEDEVTGVYKTTNTLSYLRIFEAGHEVPAYGKGKLRIGQAAKAFFDQTISNRPLSAPLVVRNDDPRQNSNSNPSVASSFPCPTSYLLLPLFVGLLLSL
ncbi:hypothetical protein PCASD_15248 [Puccinia coronata f. sp. avenae]|uniref:Carboxypeptidase n=1 Tax=Puccinia coronata f. sp. avenae TaxID=200324 RepID=A0A2N5TCA8_9BASI|nr:hypothetical protein PCASD_15248 [Puccinia coronata f. sp. avenae]